MGDYSPLREPFCVESAVSCATAHTLEWLALALTPGLGPTRVRKLVECLGTPAAVFRASLTELESAEIQAISAQSINMGK